MDDTTDRLDLDAIRARAEAATPGEWWYDDDGDTWSLHGVAAHVWSEPPASMQILKAPKKHSPYAEYWPNPADAEFIAHARTDVPALVAEVARLRVERDTLAAELDRDRHEFVEDGIAETCAECDRPCGVPVHRTSRVVLAEHAEGQ